MVIEATSIVGSSKGLQYQADDKELSKEICRSQYLIGDDPKDWHKQMREVENQNSRVENRRISVVISPSKEVSGNLKLSDWNDLVFAYLDKMKIDKENYHFVSHLHTSTDDPHAHITISRIPIADKNYKFSAINDNNIGTKAGIIADKIAKENGWRTAKEIADSKRKSIGESLRIVLKSVKNFSELKQAMRTHGFEVKLAENEVKGIYGMRIVPTQDINNNPSERALNSKQGYKLSEIERFPDRKAKFKIADLKLAMERNLFNSMSSQERVAYAYDKNEKLFSTNFIPVEGQSNTDKDIQTQSNITNSKDNVIENIIDELMKSSPTKSDDELSKKKKKKKR